MKISFVVFSLLITVFAGANNLITLTHEVLGRSIAKQAEICKDEAGSLTINEIIKSSEDGFMYLDHNVSNLDFTNSYYWMKFTVKNETEFENFILETARPITNKVDLYEVKNGKVLNLYKNGDGYPFSSKTIDNRKSLFPLHLNKGEQKDIYIHLKSDGEVITIPLIFYQRDNFYQIDSRTQFLNGLYYGILFLIIIIYFFFFLFLQDKSFLFYITYVAGIFMLQFSLDGYSFQYIFNENVYLANHIVLLSAAATVFLVLQYAKTYLSLKSKSTKFYNAYRVLQLLMLLFGVLSLIPGGIYRAMYPVINGVSLVSILLILYTVYYLKSKGESICNFFASAFTVLIVGAVIFILGNFNVIFDPTISQNALKLSSGLEAIILSVSMARKYREMQQAKEKVQAEALMHLQEKNKLIDEMNVSLEKQVKERTEQLLLQKEEIEEKNKEIFSSIRYAQRIQSAILPSDEQVKKILPDSFIFYKPKDVVSGDFYFVEETITSNTNQKLALFGAVDCTGHGVPGAFMSIVGNNFLRQSVQEQHVNTTGQALEYLNKGVCNTLRQNANNSTVRDGMDVALCALDFENEKLYFSGAKNPVYIVRSSILPEIERSKRNPVKSESEALYLNEIKGDAHPIGAYVGESLKPFTTNSIQLQKGDVIYIFSDGFQDQFGGDKGKKYNVKSFKLFLMKISQLEMDLQLKAIQDEFENWRGELEQVDDICVIGVRV